jgi:oligoribonuclease NrnB/cAMP/cGMP phosphodiesterase (DHH superfamily)
MVVDHHQTSVDEIGGEPGVLLAETHSAAGLVWRLLHGAAKRAPAVVRHVEDNDLWLNADADTPAVVTALALLYRYEGAEDFPALDALLGRGAMAALLREGRSFARYKDALIDANSQPAMTGRRTLDGHLVAVANAEVVGLSSEMANAMARRNPDCAFAALWAFHYGAGNHMVLLRAVRDGVDLSKLARRYGGGGHARAATFFYEGDIHALFRPVGRAARGRT